MNHLRKLTPSSFLPRNWSFPPDEPLKLPVLACELQARNDWLGRKCLPRQLPEALRRHYAFAWQQEAMDRGDALLAYQNEEAQGANRSRG